METMKILSIIKRGYGGTGPSSAARYVSFRDRDEKREGSEPRKLFSATEEKMSAALANRFLGNGEQPKANEVLHVVVSLEKEQDFNRLGNDEASRMSAVRETMRNAMNDVADHFNTDGFRWVAGIHRNTDNPHIHLLIHRSYVDRASGRIKQLTAFQRDLRFSWSSGSNGERVNHPGVLSLAFERHMERYIELVKVGQERTEQKLREDRQILGRAMMAEDAADRLSEVRNAAIELGDQRRYKLVDGQGHGRWLSEHDLRLKAGVRAHQSMTRLSPGWFPNVRRKMQKEVFSEEMARYQPAIREIRELRRAELDWMEAKWLKAVRAYHPLLQRAAEIEVEYQNSGMEKPTPELTREELNRLQNRAVVTGNPARFRNLEAIRRQLAMEQGRPTRSDGEIGRLRAQLFVNQSALLVEREALRGFEEMKHLRRWVIGGQNERNGGQIEVSLAEVDRELAWQSDQAKFIGERKLHWDDARRAAAAGRATELREQRKQVLHEIAAERERLSSRIAAKEEMVGALNSAFHREAAVYERNGIEIPDAVFIEQEIKELAAHADRRRDPQFHREVSKLEREHDARLFGTGFMFADRVSRSMAREVMAGIAVREATIALQRFTNQRDQTTVIVNEVDAQNIKLGKLADLQPRTPLEQIFHPLIERSERYRLVVDAVVEHDKRLQQRLENATANHAILQADARERQQEFSRLHPNKTPPRPQFTAREIGQLERQAMKENDPALREHYEQLYREAITNPRTDSAMREKKTNREKAHQIIVLDEREAASIFDSGGFELHRDVQHQQAQAWEHDDSKASTSFER